MPPLKSNFVKGQDVTAAFINELAEAVNTGGLSDAGIAALVEDPTSETKATLDTTYVRSVNGVPVDPQTGNVQVSGGGSASFTEDPTRPGIYLMEA